MKLLIVAATYALPYRVLRCAHQSGAEVSVIGNLGAQPLAMSRYCNKFVLSHRIINGSYDEEAAFEINCLARQLGVAMILPGDASSTRLLIACRHLLELPCFPLPSLEQFDDLNDKWRFAQLCGELGLRHPPTRLLQDPGTLEEEISAGRLAYPALVKPRTLSGNQGFVELNDQGSIDNLKSITYRPLLVQTFIPGRHVVVSIYCRSGSVTAFVAHHYSKRIYSTFWNQSLFCDAERVAARLRLDGVYNFDLIAGGRDDFYYLECNPRFFYSMNHAMLAGINFVAVGLAGDRGPNLLRVPDGTTVRAPEAVLASPRSWLRLTRRDLAAAAYAFSDPVPLIFDHLGWPT